VERASSYFLPEVIDDEMDSSSRPFSLSLPFTFSTLPDDSPKSVLSGCLQLIGCYRVVSAPGRHKIGRTQLPPRLSRRIVYVETRYTLGVYEKQKICVQTIDVKDLLLL
jgi:hypothetical protein